jgi:hypothetical protein
MAKQRERINITLRRKTMRRKVREMEAFGWVLDDYEEVSDRMVRMKFWRPLDLANMEKLRELEYALSRLPREESVFGLKALLGVLVCMLIGTVVGLSVNIWWFGMEIFLLLILVVAAWLDQESRKLWRRRDIIIDRAKRLSASGAALETKMDRIPGDGAEGS